MKRPFRDKRPIGPLTDLYDSADYGKEVVGVSGTPFPNRDKNPMVIIYKLDGNPVFVDDFTEAIQQEVDQLVDSDFQNVKVEYKKSGISSKGRFSEPAIVLRLPGKSMPFNDVSLHRVEQIIIRIAETSDLDLTVSGIIIEQE
jgi:hypothetical protein